MGGCDPDSGDAPRSAAASPPTAAAAAALRTAARVAAACGGRGSGVGLPTGRTAARLGARTAGSARPLLTGGRLFRRRFRRPGAPPARPMASAGAHVAPGCRPGLCGRPIGNGVRSLDRWRRGPVLLRWPRSALVGRVGRARRSTCAGAGG